MRYEIGFKGIFELTLKKEVCWDSCYGYGYNCRNFTTHLYIFEDKDGDEYVWKTSSPIYEEIEEGHREYLGYFGKVLLKGTVKDYKQYNGVDQIVLTRCQVKMIDDFGLNEEQYEEYRINQQLKSITDKDEVRTVTYKEYKEKYSEYETVRGSFKRTENGSFIDIIIRG